MMKINNHPENKLFRAFASGELAGASALILSAHVDMCPRCQSALAKEEARLAQENLGGTLEQIETDIHDPTGGLDDAMLAMMENIVSQPIERESRVARQMPEPLRWQDREFYLPRALQRYVEKTEHWRRLGSKFWRCQVKLGAEVSASFIYMKKGASIPLHTHKGCEFTLVLDGEFCDESGCYGPGDIILRDQNHEHSPYTEDEHGCLCFAVVDAPLHFTKGLSRLMNPLSHLFN